MDCDEETQSLLPLRMLNGGRRRWTASCRTTGKLLRMHYSSFRYVQLREGRCCIAGHPVEPQQNLQCCVTESSGSLCCRSIRHACATHHRLVRCLSVWTSFDVP